MVIWSRWGFLSFLCIGLAVAVVVGLLPALGAPTQGALMGAMLFALAAGFNWLLVRFVYARLDKPVPVTYTQRLPEPVVHPNGARQTHAVHTAHDEQGNPLWRRPNSSLFFIPVRYLTFVFLAVALVLLIVGLVR